MYDMTQVKSGPLAVIFSSAAFVFNPHGASRAYSTSRWRNLAKP